MLCILDGGLDREIKELEGIYKERNMGGSESLIYTFS